MDTLLALDWYETTTMRVALSLQVKTDFRNRNALPGLKNHFRQQIRAMVSILRKIAISNARARAKRDGQPAPKSYAHVRKANFAKRRATQAAEALKLAA